MDFETHRKDCIKRGKACPRCSELFTEVGLEFHLINSICGLQRYDVIYLCTRATEVNDKRISVLVKDYYKKILDAVENGKFTIRLTFVYPDDSQLVRADALSRMVSELKKLFTNVDIKADHLGSFIDVSWNKSAFYMACVRDSIVSQKNINQTIGDDDDLPDAFKTLPEKKDEVLHGIKKEFQAVMSKTISKKTKDAIWEKYIGSNQLPASTHEED
jgi:hypothetical protein